MAAETFGKDWIAAWNSLDLECIREHYADDVVFKSPRVQAAFHRSDGAIGDASGVLHGWAQLRPYFAEALEKVKGLSLTLDKVTQGCGPDELALVYRRETGSTVVEVFRLNSERKAQEVQVYYDVVA